MDTNKGIYTQLKKYKSEIIFILIGLCLSIISFYVYFGIETIPVLIVSVVIIDLVYTYVTFKKVILDHQEWLPVAKITLGILFVFYFVMIIGIIIGIVYLTVFNFNFTYDIFLYAVFVAPSFAIVLTLLFLMTFFLG